MEDVESTQAQPLQDSMDIAAELFDDGPMEAGEEEVRAPVDDVTIE